MSRYKEELKQAEKERDFHFGQMFNFGQIMMAKMGLSHKDFNRPRGIRSMTWDIPGFTLSVRSFPQNGWLSTIVASPSGVNGDNIGYSNTSEKPPSGWFYSPGGTGTIFYPPECIQKEILDRI